MVEMIMDVLPCVVMYICGSIMGYIECKKRFNIPKKAKTAKDLEVNADGCNLT